MAVWRPEMPFPLRHLDLGCGPWLWPAENHVYAIVLCTSRSWDHAPDHRQQANGPVAQVKARLASGTTRGCGCAPRIRRTGLVEEGSEDCRSDRMHAPYITQKKLLHGLHSTARIGRRGGKFSANGSYGLKLAPKVRKQYACDAVLTEQLRGRRVGRNVQDM
jgi:hypothetical protein